MKAIRKFDEFIKKNIVKKQSVDKSRAEFLIKEAKNSYNNLLEKIEKIKFILEGPAILQLCFPQDQLLLHKDPYP